MVLKRLFLCLFATVLTTRNVAASDCIDGVKYEYNIKYDCSSDGQYLKAKGCVTGKNQDGKMIEFGSFFNDTDYKFQCATVGENFAYLPKFCVFREITPSKPTILSGGEKKLLAPALQAVCEKIEKGAVRKQIKQLEYHCDWAGGHYKNEQRFKLADVKNEHQSGAQFQCKKGKVTQIACRSSSTKQMILLDGLEMSKDGSAMMCKKSADEREGVALYTLQPFKIMVGKCKQGAKTYNVKDEWDDADGKHWYRCDYNAKQNKAFITKGCVGYSKSTRPKYFKKPEKLKKLRFNANEYFKLSKKSTYLCAPDGSFVDVFTLGCKDAKGNTKKHGKKYVIGKTTVFKCSEKMLRNDDGAYYVKPNWYLYGCVHKKQGRLRNQYYRTDALRESVAANGAKQMYACHKEEGKQETIWLPLVSAVYEQKISMGSNKDTTTTTSTTTTTTPTTTPTTTTIPTTTTPPCNNLNVTGGTWKLIETKGDDDTKVAAITCNRGLSSYYNRVNCTDGKFVPASVLCGRFPSPADRGAFRYHGQFFKAYGNRWHNYGGAAGACKRAGGTMATVLSTYHLAKLKHIVPVSRYVMIGLRQKNNQRGRNIGWYWIDSTTGITADIDTGKTPRLLWRGYEPNDVSAGRPGGRERNVENFGCIARGRTGPVSINDIPYHHAAITYFMCQYNYPYYEFPKVRSGHRLTFPLESTVNSTSLEECNLSCAKDAFCRSFSFSAALSKCDHHSMPPNDPESVVVSDPNYDIYA